MEVTREGEARSGGGVASDGAAEASRLRAELAALKATCRELALRLATSKAQQAASSPGAVAALSRVLSAVAAGRALEDALRTVDRLDFFDDEGRALQRQLLEDNLRRLSARP